MNHSVYLDRELDMADVLAVANGMRQSDKDEIWASHNAEPLEALLVSLESSVHTWVVRMGEKAVGIFGVAGTGEVGSPWLLGTDELSRYQSRFLRGTRECLDWLLTQYSMLENYVDQRNTISIKWLKWCGYTISEPAPYGVEQQLFCKFTIRS